MSTTILGKVSITPKGAWKANASYERLDAVSYNGSSFLARRSNQNVVPTEGDDWQMMAEKATAANTIDDRDNSKTYLYKLYIRDGFPCVSFTEQQEG